MIAWIEHLTKLNTDYLWYSMYKLLIMAWNINYTVYRKRLALSVWSPYTITQRLSDTPCGRNQLRNQLNS